MLSLPKKKSKKKLQKCAWTRNFKKIKIDFHPLFSPLIPSFRFWPLIFQTLRKSEKSGRNPDWVLDWEGLYEIFLLCLELMFNKSCQDNSFFEKTKSGNCDLKYFIILTIVYINSLRLSVCDDFVFYLSRRGRIAFLTPGRAARFGSVTRECCRGWGVGQARATN
jgi:hypothetical protein